MKVGVIQASSQREKNPLIYDCTKRAAEPHGHTVINFGVFTEGMMLACNSLPGVLCGYLPTPQDAFLFGRINGGNAASLPLGLGFGWMGEINLQCTLDKLFDGDFGVGWPPSESERKRRDTELLKTLNSAVKRPRAECLARYPEELVKKAAGRENVMEYIRKFGKEPDIWA